MTRMRTLSAIVAARNDVQQIKPAATMAYIDEIQMWLQQPLTRVQLNRLAQQCGSCYWCPETKRGQPEYGQRLQLRQPSRSALHSFRARGDVLINRLELALDWTFDDHLQRDEASDLVGCYLVKRWHGRQQLGNCEGTLYTSRRLSVPTNLVVYADRPCRITGEVNCVHVEWRTLGVRNLRRCGLATIDELLRLDHRSFWQRRLVLRAVNFAALGRHYHNTLIGSHRRNRWIQNFGPVAYDYDVRAGCVLARLAGSVQALIDEHHNSFDVIRCLAEIDVGHLLPISSTEQQHITMIHDSWCQPSKPAPNPSSHNNICRKQHCKSACYSQTHQPEASSRKLKQHTDMSKREQHRSPNMPQPGANNSVTIRRRRIRYPQRHAVIDTMKGMSFESDDHDLLVNTVHVFSSPPNIAVSFAVAAGSINVVLPPRLADQLGEALRRSAAAEIAQHAPTRRRLPSR